MIEIKNLTHFIGDRKILDKVNLTLEEGCVMGLVGINGAGKTTLLRLISGVYSPTKGDMLCDGEPLSVEEAHRKIFFLPDDPYYTIHTT
jgi:ABC-2 type transport system ATP-binding protein